VAEIRFTDFADALQQLAAWLQATGQLP
jgi:hypothetical protein